MSKCCGDNRKSNFCPVCGKQLRGASLLSLLRHCENNAGRERAKIKPGAEEENPRWYERRVATAVKWETWANDIRAIIEE